MVGDKVIQSGSRPLTRESHRSPFGELSAKQQVSSLLSQLCKRSQSLMQLLFCMREIWCSAKDRFCFGLVMGPYWSEFLSTRPTVMLTLPLCPFSDSLPGTVEQLSLHPGCIQKREILPFLERFFLLFFDKNTNRKAGSQHSHQFCIFFQQ